MTYSIHIYYGKKLTGQLVIACYHERITALFKAKRVSQDSNVLTNYLTCQLPESYSIKTVAEYLKGLLTTLVQKENDFTQVIFAADLNLCCKDKGDLALFLFDNTLNDFFSGKTVYRILESSDPLYVNNAIESIKTIEGLNLNGVTLKTKDSVVGVNTVCEIYGDEKVNLLVPKPSIVGLASPEITIRNATVLGQVASQIGIFKSAENLDKDEEKKTQNKGTVISPNSSGIYS